MCIRDRAIRSETDTCVVSLLDQRAAPGRRYYRAAVDALPSVPITGHITDVAGFIHVRKPLTYFAFSEGATI